MVSVYRFKMGRLWKVCHQDVPLVSSLESAVSVGEAFLPNDFAEDGSYPMSPVVTYLRLSSLLIYFLVFSFDLILFDLFYFFFVCRIYLETKEGSTKLFWSSISIKYVPFCLLCSFFLLLFWLFLYFVFCHFINEVIKMHYNLGGIYSVLTVFFVL